MPKKTATQQLVRSYIHKDYLSMTKILISAKNDFKTCFKITLCMAYMSIGPFFMKSTYLILYLLVCVFACEMTNKLYNALNNTKPSSPCTCFPILVYHDTWYSKAKHSSNTCNNQPSSVRRVFYKRNHFVRCCGRGCCCLWYYDKHRRCALHPSAVCG